MFHKFIRIIAILVLGLSFWACSDDNTPEKLTPLLSFNLQGVNSNITVFINGTESGSSSTSQSLEVELKDFEEGESIAITYESDQNQFCEINKPTIIYSSEELNKVVNIKCYSWNFETNLQISNPKEIDLSDINILVNEKVIATSNLNQTSTTTVLDLEPGDTYTVTYENSDNILCEIDNTSGTVDPVVKNIAITINCYVWSIDVDLQVSNPGDVVLSDFDVLVNGTVLVSNNESETLTVPAFDLRPGDLITATYESDQIHFCNVSSTEGLVSIQALELEVDVTCLIWDHPDDLTDDISPENTASAAPQVVINNQGNGIAVWSQSNFLNTQIFMSEFNDGVWSHPSGILDHISPAGENAFNPQVALSENGDAVITWTQFSGTNFLIYMSEKRNGIWSHPQTLSENISPTSQNAAFPQVAISDNGETVIVWEQLDGTNTQIYASEFRSNFWFHPAGLGDRESVAGENAILAQVSANAAGDAVVAWEQFDGNHFKIFRSEYRNGSWIRPSTLNEGISPAGSNAVLARTAIGDNGDALIVWEQSDGSNTQIFRSEYRSGLWSDPVDQMDYISLSGENAATPEVSINETGESIIVWAQGDGVYSRIYRSEYKDLTWSGPQSFSDAISIEESDANFPVVEINSSGQSIIAWTQFDASDNIQVFRSEYYNDSWRNPEFITDFISPQGESVSLGDIESPIDLTLNNTGESFIVWPQFNGSENQVYLSGRARSAPQKNNIKL